MACPCGDANCAAFRAVAAADAQKVFAERLIDEVYTVRRDVRDEWLRHVDAVDAPPFERVMLLARTAT